MNVVLVLLKLCFSWFAPVETVRVSQPLTRSPMNPMALLVVPVRLQLARIHPPPQTHRRR